MTNKAGVIGFGYWGPNVVRNFYNHPQCTVKYICDIDPVALKRARNQYPEIDITDDPEQIFEDPESDIVAIVTPVSTHFDLAQKAFQSGKHVFLEKPMTETVEQADLLIRLAKQKNLIGVVDHPFLFTGAVRKIKEIVDSGEIGEITYFDSVRVNLGLFQHDVDVIWDLAPHDLSILFYISGEKPFAVTSNGVSHLNNGLMDVGYITLHYSTAMIANFHVNWLSPVKVRKILIGGTKKMIVYDDVEPSDKIKIYDKGVEVKEEEDIHRLLVNYRSGDMRAPTLPQREALNLEVSNFIEQIKQKRIVSINDLYQGKAVVAVLEAAKKSLETQSRVPL